MLVSGGEGTAAREQLVVATAARTRREQPWWVLIVEAGCKHDALAVRLFEAKYMFSEPIPALDQIDGYQLVLKAHALQNDAAMQQAARLIVDGRPSKG